MLKFEKLTKNVKKGNLFGYCTRKAIAVEIIKKYANSCIKS